MLSCQKKKTSLNPATMSTGDQQQGGGKEAEIIIDLKCPMWLESFSIMNGFGDFGTNQFSLSGSLNPTGPWTDLYRGELTQGVEMTEEVKFMIFTRDYNFLCRILSVVSVLK